MSDPAVTTPAEAPAEGGRRRARGGADARRALRRGGPIHQLKYITRQIPPYEVLSEELLQIIEANADTVLEEIGIEVGARGLHRAAADAGPTGDGARVQLDRGFAWSRWQNAPTSFTLRPRNPERAVVIGGGRRC